MIGANEHDNYQLIVISNICSGLLRKHVICFIET